MVRKPVLIFFAYEMEQDEVAGKKPIDNLLSELNEFHNLSTKKNEVMILDWGANVIYGDEKLVSGIIGKISGAKV